MATVIQITDCFESLQLMEEILINTLLIFQIVHLLSTYESEQAMNSEAFHQFQLQTSMEKNGIKKLKQFKLQVFA